MGLYLCVFDGDDELEGVEVGSYEDFGFVRDTVREKLEAGRAGSQFPTLMLHSDCDGAWTAGEAGILERELEIISEGFKEMPASAPRSEWQGALIRSLGLRPASLYDSFIDVDGEPLLERLIVLCKVAQATGRPILFQ